MDEDMEECEVPVFEVVEIDLDYEFDAVRFFDFCRRETVAEVHEAESWFELAPSNPPSPFVAKLFLREDIMSNNVNTSPKSRGVDISMLSDESYVVQHAGDEGKEQTNDGFKGIIQTILKDIHDGDMQNAQCWREALIAASCRGLTQCNQSVADMGETKTKPMAKRPFERKSTLMKPTMSQLAKKSLGHQVSNARLTKVPVEKNESCNTHMGGEIQASKRQKLDGGCLHKVGDLKQPSNLVHKLAKKDETISGMSTQIKLKSVVPREPELKTAFRAQRLRSTTTKEMENAAATTCRFKARPLNRKILEAPMLPIPKRSTPTLPEFHVFHRKTTERAMQHAATVSSSSHGQNDKGLGRANANPIVDNGKKDGKRSELVHTSNKGDHSVPNRFKARPLDKKLFTSKGDLGVLKNLKRDITVPKGFDFQTEKRTRQNPPVELFSKLSLASEVLPNATGLKVPPACLRSKGSKENIFGSFQEHYNIKDSEDEKITCLWPKED